jgi:hypothetical protein
MFKMEEKIMSLLDNIKGPVGKIGRKVHPISLTAMPEADFENLFLALKGKDQSAYSNPDNYMANVPVKVWNGGFSKDKETGEYDMTKVANDTVNLPINFAKMSDAFSNLTKTEPVKANTPLLENGSPVMVTTLTDVTTNDKKYAISIDPSALAAANAQQHYDASQKAFAEGKTGKAMSDKQLDAAKTRFNVDMRLNTTDKSVAGISAKAVEANIGKIATQNYIFNPAFAGKNEADPVGKISGVASKVSADYTKFIMDKFGEAISSPDGLGEIKSAAEGKENATIPGTAIGAFPGKIKTVTDGEATRYVIQADAATKDATNQWFKDLNNRLSKQWAQEVFQNYPSDSIENKLASNIRPQMYSVNPQGSDAILVQPGMIATFAPYVNSLVNAYDVATHGRDIPGEDGKPVDRSKATEGNGKSVEDIYGKDSAFVKNANALYTKYTDLADSLKQVERGETLKALESIDFSKGDDSISLG